MHSAALSFRHKDPIGFTKVGFLLLSLLFFHGQLYFLFQVEDACFRLAMRLTLFDLGWRLTHFADQGPVFRLPVFFLLLISSALTAYFFLGLLPLAPARVFFFLPPESWPGRCTFFFFLLLSLNIKSTSAWPNFVLALNENSWLQRSVISRAFSLSSTL